MRVYQWQFLVVVNGLIVAMFTTEALLSRQVQVPLQVLTKAHYSPTKVPRALRNNNNNINIIDDNDDEEEIFVYDLKSRFLINSSNSSTSANYLDDLTPPPINWARDSILFSENPATKRNNAGVEIWRFCQHNLPPVFTGTWSWRDTNIVERNPLGALYNMVVVRIPTIGIGLVYINNLLEGHPLIMDFGQGAFEMSPILVFAVLALILA